MATITHTPGQVETAKTCLRLKLALWDATRDLELELEGEGGEVDGLDGDLGNFCVCLDEPESVTEVEATKFLDMLAEAKA